MLETLALLIVGIAVVAGLDLIARTWGDWK